MPLSRKTWRCPGETRLAAYVDRKLDPDTRLRLESHLAKCDHCLGQVGFLLRSEDLPPAQAPPALIARARELAMRPGRTRQPFLHWGFQWGAVAAAAACLVVAANLWVHQPQPDAPPVMTPAPKVVAPAPAPAPTPEPPQRTVRGAPSPAVPDQIFPRPDSTVARQDLEFRWKEIPSALFYEVRVVTADGDVVWETKSTGTAVRPPQDLTLAAGQKYFVWIRAHLPEGKALQSRASAFTVRNE